ncbi:hypothetical protein [Microcystis aeruginosa]|nr:hypothetical protein [Microcystis aeruginosa]
MLEIVAGILLNRWLFGPMIAVMVILINAGPGLDREKLAAQGTVALGLGLLRAAYFNLSSG